MSDAEQRAALLFHPLAKADATGYDGVFRKAITAASQNFAIPPGLKGKFLLLEASANVQFAFGNGTSAPTLVYDQTADLGTGHASAGGNVFANTYKDGRIPGDATFIAWIGTASAGFFSGYISEKPAP